MSYQQIKWLIIIIPSLTIGLWEYVRHEFLLPYISMSLGNWLAPVIVLGVSMVLLTSLFRMMEHIQAELNEARALKAVLEERERIASELHDGIAQSLFLLSVQLDQHNQKQEEDRRQDLESFRKTVHQTNQYVRQAILHLRNPADTASLPWNQMIQALVTDLEQNTGVEVIVDWTIPEESLSAKDKVELHAIIREALQNVRKHAGADRVWLKGKFDKGVWECSIIDDGQGLKQNTDQKTPRYGLQIMKERAKKMGWKLKLKREEGRTVVYVKNV